ncbi:hypothetical protein ACFLQ7_03780 [Actinomycetota bacterium]
MAPIARILLVVLVFASGCSNGNQVTEVTGDTGMCTPSEPVFTGEPLEGANLPGSVIEAVVTCPESNMSDDRIAGATESDFRCEYVNRDGVIVAECTADKVITNNGGTWTEDGGTFTITGTGFPDDGLVVQDGVMLGTGDYAGLQYTYHMEGIEHAYPWTITGTIEPTT